MAQRVVGSSRRIVVGAAAVLLFASSACSQTRDSPVDAGKDVTAPVLVYNCTTDSDCCTAVDSCKATAHVVTRTQQAVLQAYLDSSTTGTMAACVACIPPAVQISCQAGQCVGVKLPTSSDNYVLTSPHCGVLPVDAGPSVLDGGSASLAIPQTTGTTTGTVFSCGS